jgi:hypothetical protein
MFEIAQGAQVRALTKSVISSEDIVLPDNEIQDPVPVFTLKTTVDLSIHSHNDDKQLQSDSATVVSYDESYMILSALPSKFKSQYLRSMDDVKAGTILVVKAGSFEDIDKTTLAVARRKPNIVSAGSRRISYEIEVYTPRPLRL